MCVVVDTSATAFLPLWLATCDCFELRCTYWITGGVFRISTFFSCYSEDSDIIILDVRLVLVFWNLWHYILCLQYDGYILFFRDQSESLIMRSSFWPLTWNSQGDLCFEHLVRYNILTICSLFSCAWLVLCVCFVWPLISLAASSLLFTFPYKLSTLVALTYLFIFPQYTYFMWIILIIG